MTATILPKRLRDFLASIDRRADGECWPWSGALNADGYPRFSLNGAWLAPAQLTASMRFGWWLRERTEPRIARAPDPHGRIPHWDQRPRVRRSCDNAVCCNPAHMLVHMRSFDEWDDLYAERSRERLAARELPPPGAMDR